MSALRYRLTIVVVVCLLVPAAMAWSQQPRGKKKPQSAPVKIPDTVVVERDVEYGRAGDVSLKLDIVRPKEPSENPRPVIAFIHGGGWSGGNKAVFVGTLVPFADSGNYFCVSIEYRLSGVATWPAQIHDCKAAIRWLKVNAKKYNIDPEKIGVWGSSAGGHLVSMLGVSGDVPSLEGDSGSPGVSSRVACVVDYCGPSDFPAIAGVKETYKNAYQAVSKLLGGPIEEKGEAARNASPMTYVSKAAVAFLIVHGTHDTTVPPPQADVLYAALKKAGVDATFIKILDGTHGVAPSGGPQLLERVQAFFDKHLRGKDIAVSDEPIQSQPMSQPKPKS